MSVHLATGPFCDNINTMDNLSAHFRGAIEDVEADFDHNYFSLQINACLPDSHCVGVATTLIFLTNGNQKTNVYSTKDRKIHYDVPYIHSATLYANDELCLVREINQRMVIYEVRTWRNPKVLKEDLKIKAAGQHLFHIDHNKGKLNIYNENGMEFQDHVEHSALGDIEFIPRSSQILPFITFSHRGRSIKVWSFDEAKKSTVLKHEYTAQTDFIRSLQVRGDILILKDWNLNAVFHYLNGLQVDWAKKKLSTYKMRWTKHWVCFTDGTHVIGTPSTGNMHKISCFTIFGSNGIEKRTFKHENVCGITILKDLYIITAGDDMKLKIWSKDGECIREMDRDHETATSIIETDDNIWIISYSGGRIVSTETWDFGTLIPSSGQNPKMLEFVSESDRFWRRDDD